jgi:rod shape-determining protein MreD
MGNYLGLPVLIVAAALQVTFMPQIRILGGEPDLTFLIVLSWAVNARLEEGIVWAFVGGIARDLLTAAPTGASVLGLLILVFGIDRLRQQVFGIGLITLIALVIGGTILQEVIYMGIIALVGYQIRPVEMFSYTVVPTAAYNLVFIWPVYWFVRRTLRPQAKPRGVE